MTKEELKQKILKVLKVFNGREEAIFDTCWKEIADLEKKNAELKKENAELKEKYRKRGEVISMLERQIRLYIHSDQLTKAKEIIKGLLSSKTDFDEKRFVLWAWKEEVEQAEQFLKEN